MSTTTKSFENWNVADFWRSWLQPPPPNAFVQPILPGWTLNINSNNSSAPLTEVNAVAKHSYGRQLGRISDALHALLIEKYPTNPPETGPFGEFLAMWKDIEKVKTESATARLDQIASDLALLKDKNHVEFVRLRDALRQALKQTD